MPTSVGNVFYTSDLHFNHEFVARDRMYQTAEEHDEELIHRFNKVLGKRDQLWILGDVFMGSITKGLPQVDRLNGTKHLVLGNHDAAHPMHRRSHSQLRRFYDSFESVSLHEQHRIAGHEVLLSHFPYEGDHHGTDRGLQWRLRDEGNWLLHGHVHKAWGIKGRQLNVGVDPNSRPVPREHIEDHILEQS